MGRAMTGTDEARERIVQWFREMGSKPRGPSTAEDWADALIAAGFGERQGWREIESAPKDGKVVLLARFLYDGTNLLCVASDFWTEEGGWCDWGPGDHQPTHWMPLPEPPR